MKKLCPHCYMGRVDKSGRKPYKLNSEFKNCPHCGGLGLTNKEDFMEEKTLHNSDVSGARPKVQGNGGEEMRPLMFEEICRVQPGFNPYHTPFYLPSVGAGTLCCKWCWKDLSGATQVTYLNGNQACCDLCLMKAGKK